MDGTILGKKYDIINGEGGGGGKLTPATADTLGGIKIGNGLSVTEDGTASVNFPPAPEPYVLPKATDQTLGGVKIGNGLSINAETGVLSNANISLNYSTTEQNTGRKWIDGNDIYFITIDMGEEKTVTSNTWYTVGNHLGADIIVNGIGISGGGGTIPMQIVEDTTDGIKILQTRNAQVGVRYLWLEYTKAEV